MAQKPVANALTLELEPVVADNLARYLATADEKDSTRGRARVLQEVVRGALDWRSPAVAGR